MTAHLDNAKKYARNWTLLWAVVFSCVVSFSIWLSDGHLIYTLDDPYIHLSVAENIIRGGYGVNLTEFSSPSSSILYPLLLSITELASLGGIGPLLINAVAAGLSVWLLLEFFWRYAMPEKSPLQAAFPNTVAPFLILSINGLALPMTGMEHSLHVLAVLATVRGLVLVSEKSNNASVPLWLALAIIAGPLIRFEGIALSGAAVLALILLKRWRAAAIIGAVLLACLGTYGFVMHQLGLPLLPSSVMVKSNVFTTGTVDSGLSTKVLAIVHNIQSSLTNRWGVIFILVICALMVTAVFKYRNLRRGISSNTTTPVIPPNIISAHIISGEFLIIGIMGLTLSAHIVAGRYGWFHRYEVYAVSIMVIGSIYLLRGTIQHLITAQFKKIQIGVTIALVLLTIPYLGATLVTPLASRGIYEQQFQMHRFATKYFPHAVAVNDLGWVSYNNDSYVLDLWGLGSEQVRRLRSNGKLTPETIGAVVDKANVDYAMIYYKWFRQGVPKNWCLLAILKTKTVTSSNDTIHFFATNPGVIAQMSTALDQFTSTLRKPTTLERFTCSS